MTKKSYLPLYHIHIQYQKSDTGKPPQLIILDLLDGNNNKINAIKNELIVFFSQQQKTLPPLLAYIDIESKNKQQVFDLGMDDYISQPLTNFYLYYRTPQLFTHTHYKNKFYPVIDNKNLAININDDLAKKTASYLLKNLGSEIRLSCLSRKMASNRNKLSSTFKAHFGCTIFSWVRDQRMLHAAELLTTSSQSILHISEKVGYLDSNNFSTAFKKTMGKSPRQYRQEFLVKLQSTKKPMQKKEVLILENN